MKMKIFFVAIILGLGILGLYNVSQVSAAYTPIAGDIIKTPSNPAVYYIGTDTKRHLYVNEATFWTWHTGSWSKIQSEGKVKSVKIISQEEFDTISSGTNITARPGSGLIKFENSPQLYQVTDHGKLTLLPDTATAQQLFGTNWNSRVIAIQAGFEGNYTKNTTPNIPLFY
jgi:hypothetical protein